MSGISSDASGSPVASINAVSAAGGQNSIVIGNQTTSAAGNSSMAIGNGANSSGRIQIRSATPVNSVNEGGVLRAVDQQLSVHRQR